VSLRRTRGRVDMVAAEIFTELQSFRNRQICQILSTECDYFSLCYESRKLILSSIAELAQLYTFDLSSDGWCEVGDVGVFR
jgi:hypothetical protein